MSDQQNLTLLWDDTISIDEAMLSLLRSIGLSPLPVNIHTLDRIEADISGPAILHLSAESFASLEATIGFIKKLAFEAFSVLRIQPHQIELGMEAVRLGFEEVVVERNGESRNVGARYRKSSDIIVKARFLCLR